MTWELNELVARAVGVLQQMENSDHSSTEDSSERRRRRYDGIFEEAEK